MKNRQTFILIALAALFLAACEGNTDYVYTVHNDSSDTIYVKYDYVLGIDATQSEEFTIPKNKEEVVIFHSQRGGVDHPGDVQKYESYLTITNTDGDTINRDVWDESAWRIESDHLRKIPSNWRHDFHFYVQDTDFE